MTATLNTHALLGTAEWWFDPDLTLTPNPPVESQASTVSVNVTNTGDDTQQVTVSSFWANANIGIATWGDYTQIGSTDGSTPIAGGAAASVAGGSWTPSASGHYCVVAVAVSPDNPMRPFPGNERLPSGTNPQVVQHNFWVQDASAGQVVTIRFLPFHPRSAQQTIQATRIALAKAGPQLRRAGAQSATEIAGDFGFTLHTGAVADRIATGTATAPAALTVEPSEAVTPYCEVKVPSDAASGSAALIDIRTTENGTAVGGAVLLVVVK